MPDLEKQIAAWRATQLAAVGGNADIVAEWESHLRDAAQEQLRRGLPAEQAVAVALTDLGGPATQAAEPAKQSGCIPPVRRIILSVGVAALLLGGCRQKLPIERYTAKSESIRRELLAQRLLGAMLPRNGVVWFVKVSGPDEDVLAHKEAFERFVRSMEFDPNEDPPFRAKEPEGWKKLPRSGDEQEFLVAQYLLKTGNNNLRLTVTRLQGKEADDLLANANRWRRQLGLDEMTKDKLPKVTRPLNDMNTQDKLIDLYKPSELY